jgi:hypothetical protein
MAIEMPRCTPEEEERILGTKRKPATPMRPAPNVIGSDGKRVKQPTCKYCGCYPDPSRRDGKCQHCGAPFRSKR